MAQGQRWQEAQLFRPGPARKRIKLQALEESLLQKQPGLISESTHQQLPSSRM